MALLLRPKWKMFLKYIIAGQDLREKGVNYIIIMRILCVSMGGDGAELVDHQTGMPLTRVQFPCAARDLLAQSRLPVQTLTW